MKINKKLFKIKTNRTKTVEGTIKFRFAQKLENDEEEARVLNEWINSIFSYRFSTGNMELIVRAIELENPEIKRRNKMRIEMGKDMKKSSKNKKEGSKAG